MLKLVYILLFTAEISAKIIRNIDLDREGEKYIPPNPLSPFLKEQCKTEGSLWVLDIKDNSFDFQRLFLGNDSEQRIFKKLIAPAIKADQSSSNRVKKDKPSKNDSDEKFKLEFSNDPSKVMRDIKKEIVILINKLFFSITELNEPAAYINEKPSNDEKRSIKLYFKGPYSSLIMTSGRNIYHYFISPPSPLPSWFYEHENDIHEIENVKYMEIPEKVQQEFLLKFFKLLRSIFSYPM